METIQVAIPISCSKSIPTIKHRIANLICHRLTVLATNRMAHIYGQLSPELQSLELVAQQLNTISIYTPRRLDLTILITHPHNRLREVILLRLSSGQRHSRPSTLLETHETGWALRTPKATDHLHGSNWEGKIMMHGALMPDRYTNCKLWWQWKREFKTTEKLPGPQFWFVSGVTSTTPKTLRKWHIRVRIGAQKSIKYKPDFW